MRMGEAQHDSDFDVRAYQAGSPGGWQRNEDLSYVSVTRILRTEPTAIRMLGF